MIKAEFSASLLQSHDVQKSFKYSDLLLKIHLLLLLLLLLCIMKTYKLYTYVLWVDFISGFFDE